jgi:peptide/nickel transport system substrate-binding protein
MRPLVLGACLLGFAAVPFLPDSAVAQQPGAQQPGAQQPKHGGIMRIYQRDNPGSASIHEEATYSNNVPFMGVFNNLVIFPQDKVRNLPEEIQPELATGWKFSADNRSITFTTRQGVKWHDGKPFTAHDVKCTMDLLQGKAKDSFRKNPRQSWYQNVNEVVVTNDNEVVFKLDRPQPSLLSLLASGYSPIYPCHVSAAGMRTKPIGTGPFKLVEFKQNEMIRLTRNPDYWKPGLPYLDGIEMPIITNRSTAMLAFIAGKLDMTFPTEVTTQIAKDIKSQAPKAICFLGPTNVSNNLIVNRERPPFDNADIRRAMALTLDRKSFIDIMSEGKSNIGGSLLPQPYGVWGMPPEMMTTMLGYGPNKHLAVKVSTRNTPSYRDPAVLLIDQLKEIYIDGELDVVETSVWFAKVARKDYAVGMNLTGNAVDDPDQTFYENYSCKSERNVTGYCNPALEKAFDAQSQETDVEKRKKLVWEIDRQLQNDVARPIILHIQAGTCWQPELKGFAPMINSSYNGYRFDEVWLDRQ